MSAPPPPPLVPRRKSRVIPILVTAGGGLLIAGGSCAGFLTTLNINGGTKPLNAVFAVGFFLGVLAVVVGAIWALVRAALYFFGGDKNPS